MKKINVHTANLTKLAKVADEFDDKIANTSETFAVSEALDNLHEDVAYPLDGDRAYVERSIAYLHKTIASAKKEVISEIKTVERELAVLKAWQTWLDALVVSDEILTTWQAEYDQASEEEEAREREDRAHECRHCGYDTREKSYKHGDGKTACVRVLKKIKRSKTAKRGSNFGKKAKGGR